jgi:topoisomerase-4 subunit A
LLIACDDGRFFTLGADKLPGGRGFGEPVRLMIDVPENAAIVTMLKADVAGRLLLAASNGKGFIVPMAELIAETRKGRQVMNLREQAKMRAVHQIALNHDYAAIAGENRKLVIFPLNELPEMARGQGVTLQKYKDGGLADVTTLTLSEGLSWTMGGAEGRTRTETELMPWRAARGAIGRTPPIGFPRDNRF